MRTADFWGTACRRNTTFFHGELQFLAPLYGRDSRTGVPLDPGGSGGGGISLLQSGLYRRHTHHGRRQYKKQVKVQVSAASKQYAKELMEEVNADREAHGKRPFNDDDEPGAAAKKRRDNTSKKKLARRKKEKMRTATRSVTDPDSGLFVKGDLKLQFAYETHTACDKHGFILETVVIPRECT